MFSSASCVRSSHAIGISGLPWEESGSWSWRRNTVWASYQACYTGGSWIQHPLWALIVGLSASPLRTNFLRPVPKEISSCRASPPQAAGFFSGCHGESRWEHHTQEQHISAGRGEGVSPCKYAPHPAVLVMIPPRGVAEAQGEKDEEEDPGPEPW